MFRNIPVMFVHIPKTAGVTLNSILAKQYQPEHTFKIDDNSPEASVKELGASFDLEDRHIELVTGHIPFGFYGLLPQHVNFRYITLLRHPVERIISHYCYAKSQPTHYLYNTIVSQKMSLKEYVHNAIATELDNGQVRLLAGVGDTLAWGTCSHQLLETAQTNLRNHFFVTGLTERFDESLILLKKALHWKMPLYIRQNVNRNRPPRQEVSQDTRAIIAQYNTWDLELYCYAQKLFDSQINQQGHSFQKELSAFRLFNRLYRIIARKSL